MSHVDTIFCQNCMEGMKKIESDTIDLVITDPPFAIEFGATKTNYNRKPSNVMAGYSEVSAEQYYDFTVSWMTQAYRLLKPSGSMYVFSGWNNLKQILEALDDIGFHTINHIIWKYQFGVATRKKYVTSHYTILYVCKDPRQRRFYPYSRFGKNDRDGSGRSLRYRDVEDVWHIPREYWHGSIKTPTKLPAAIIRKILAYSSKPGDTVLDPFLGSGQVAVVSKMEGRHYCGFEVVEEYYKFAKERLDTGSYRLPATPKNTTPIDGYIDQ